VTIQRVRRLHLGCGPGPQPKGWIHLDGSWNAWFAKHQVLRALLKRLRLAPRVALDLDWAPDVMVHNVTTGLPFSSDSLSAIYSSHMLEHLYFEEAQHVLCECYRVLEPGGTLRIVVPDLRAFVRKYVAEAGEMGAVPPGRTPLAAEILNERLLFRHRHPPQGGIFFKLYSALNDFHSHKWMYDMDSLSAQFVKAGFVKVGPMSAHESRIADIAQVEAIDRVAIDGLCVEGIKPSTDWLSS
jgi:ubiquinone/menaquinone biosynthesis C-methylase UbiE